MMKKMILFCTVLFFFCQDVQDIEVTEPEAPVYTLSGLVKDYDTQNALESVSVYLLEESDSSPVDTFITGTDGSFSFENNTFDQNSFWWFSYSRPGYLPKITSISFAQKDNIPVMILSKTLTLEASYPTELNTPTGIAWDGSSIWCTDADNGNIVKYGTDFSIDKTLGTTISSPRGLAYHDGFLYTCSYITRELFQIEISTGTVIMIDTLEYEQGGGYSPEIPTDISWREDYLISCESLTDKISLHSISDPDSFFVEIGTPFTDPIGIAWTGNSYFICPESGILYCDENFTKIYQFSQDILNEGKVSFLTWGDTFLWGIDKQNKKILKYSMIQY